MAEHTQVVHHSHLTELSMESHIKNNIKSCFYQLRQLWSIRKSITNSVAKSLINAFVISKLDYCNCVLYGASAVNLRSLQSVLNAAARFASKRHKFDHIADVLVNLHWLPIDKRIVYKMCMLMYKCLHNTAPKYLSCTCIPVAAEEGRSHLRSAKRGDLIVPRSKTRYGDCGFSVAGPSCWNELPMDVRDNSLSLQMFKCKLKTYLFRTAYVVHG